MTTASIALIAALGALVLVGLLSLLLRGGGRHDDDVTQALAQMGNRMDEIATQLGSALQRVRDDGSRAQAVVDLGHAGDINEVMARTVEAAALVSGIDAALVRIEGPDGHASVASSSIPIDLAEAQLLSGPPDGRRVRAVCLAYHYGGGDEPPGALRSGVAVPVGSDDRLLGFLAAYSFDPEVDEVDVIGALEAIAHAAGPAIDHALRLQGDEGPPAPLDTLTGLRNRGGFHEVLAHELARSHRLGTPLAVLILDLDGFKRLNAEVGQLAGDDVLRWTSARIRECLRDGDVACRIGSDEFAVVLPDASRIDAEGMFARVQAMLLRQPLESTPSVTLSGGIASATADDDALGLFQRAEEALRRAKAAGRGTAA